MEVKMNKYFILLVSLFFTSAACISCESNNDDNLQQVIYKPDSSLQIEKVPSSMGPGYQKFDRYSKISATNGKAIHIVAQNQISNEKIVRSRNILQHYLTNYPGSEYGADKSTVANKMADNNAVLLLLNGQDDGTNDPTIDGQALYDNEIQIEGHTWYIKQDYEHRDASFEEILHMVHDYGIGVDGPNTSPGALPAYQSEIRAAQKNALTKKLWGIAQQGWITELTNENSLSQEYLASVIDSYYGLWGAWTESSTHGMWGIYISKTRAEISLEDTMGAELMNNKFFHPYLTYNARIYAGFGGTFSLKFDTNIPYTHHSQYLKNITLTGNKNSGVEVNSYNNIICGIEGINTVSFSGVYSEYNVSSTFSEVVVTDSVSGRDGTNTLKKIEKLKFSDMTVDL